jgi:hypothetical protein
MAAALFPASRASATIDEYPMMAALRDVVKFHYTCSFMYGLEKALEEGMQTTVESKRVKLEQDKLNLELYVANKTNTLKAQGVTAAADLAADPGIKGANSRIAVIEEQLLSLLRVGAPTVNTPMVTASTVVLSADKKTSVTVPADITLTAVPTMLSGTTAANVEFFQGDKSINVATGTSGQFSHKVTGLAAGVYTFTARVTDTTGVKSAASAPVLLVVQSTNVTLVSEPTAPQPGNTITFTVTDNSKPPASGKVEFFHGRDKIGEVVAPGNVYRYTPDKNLSGINDFHARITDSAGQTSTSNLLSLAIGASAPAAAPAAPSVTLSGPTAAVAGDAKFTLKVTSSAAGRSISRIEFFKDGQRISAAGNASDTLDYLPPTKPAANSTSDFIAQVTYTDKVSVVSNKVTVTFK